MDDPFAANSVWYEPQRKRWVAVGQNAVFRSNQAVLRTAESLAGPWIAPSLLYRIPTVQIRTRGAIRPWRILSSGGATRFFLRMHATRWISGNW